MTTTWRIINADVLDGLRQLPDESVHCIVTSPPYWGLRDYEVDGQIGSEPTLREFLDVMVDVFREARRVLRSDGTLWLNLGDTYVGSRSGPQGEGGKMAGRRVVNHRSRNQTRVVDGLPAKSLIGVPWRVAFALQDDGWILRSECIWAKGNPMPESAEDRPTRSHEHVFLFSKSGRYWYDAEAVKEPVTGTAHGRGSGVNPKAQVNAHGSRQNASFSAAVSGLVDRRNLRTVWQVNTEQFDGAHFATFPTELARRCILAGCPAGGTVLDPFSGSATVGVVAMRHGRSYVGLELNPKYVELGRRRIIGDAPLFNPQREVR